MEEQELAQSAACLEVVHHLEKFVELQAERLSSGESFQMTGTGRRSTYTVIVKKNGHGIPTISINVS